MGRYFQGRLLGISNLELYHAAELPISSIVECRAVSLLMIGDRQHLHTIPFDLRWVSGHSPRDSRRTYSSITRWAFNRRVTMSDRGNRRVCAGVERAKEELSRVSDVSTGYVWVAEKSKKVLWLGRSRDHRRIEMHVPHNQILPSMSFYELISH
jgi:hypothetical protein